MTEIHRNYYACDILLYEKVYVTHYNAVTLEKV